MYSWNADDAPKSDSIRPLIAINHKAMLYTCLVNLFPYLLGEHGHTSIWHAVITSQLGAGDDLATGTAARQTHEQLVWDGEDLNFLRHQEGGLLG